MTSLSYRINRGAFSSTLRLHSEHIQSIINHATCNHCQRQNQLQQQQRRIGYYRFLTSDPESTATIKFGGNSYNSDDSVPKITNKDQVLQHNHTGIVLGRKSLPAKIQSWIKLSEQDKILRKPKNYMLKDPLLKINERRKQRIQRRLKEHNIDLDNDTADEEEARKAAVIASQIPQSKFERRCREYANNLKRFMGNNFAFQDDTLLFKAIYAIRSFDFPLRQQHTTTTAGKAMDNNTNNDNNNDDRIDLNSTKLVSLGRSFYNLTISQFLLDSQSQRATTRVYQFGKPGFHKLKDLALVNGFDFVKLSEDYHHLGSNNHGLTIKFLHKNNLNFRFNRVLLPIKESLIYRRLYYQTNHQKVKNALILGYVVNHKALRFRKMKKVISKYRYQRKQIRQLELLERKKNLKFFRMLIGLVNVHFGAEGAKVFIHEKILRGKDGLLALSASKRL